jgi:excisionase family DNA binding protein
LAEVGDEKIIKEIVINIKERKEIKRRRKRKENKRRTELWRIEMSEIQLMTIEEAAVFLNLKVSKLRKDIFNKEIPYYKIGSLIRFKKDELLKWLDKKIVPSK